MKPQFRLIFSESSQQHGIHNCSLLLSYTHTFQFRILSYHQLFVLSFCFYFPFLEYRIERFYYLMRVFALHFAATHTKPEKEKKKREINISIYIYINNKKERQKERRELLLLSLCSCVHQPMVFHSEIKMNETPPSKPAPNSLSLPPSPSLTAAKSQSQQPLHNFSLTDLKWAMNHTNTNRFRKPSDSSHKSPHYDAAVSDKHKRPLLQVQGVKSGLGVEKLADRKSTSGDGHDAAENLVNKPAPALSSDGSRSKIFIRIKTKTTKVADEVADAGDHNAVVPDDDSDDLLVPKTWNLRPRRPITKVNNNNIVNVNGGGGALKIGGGAAQEIKPPEKKDTDKDKEIEKEKKEKMKFSISLKKEEIEDDFFAMTGAKPPRRPKKRAKNVQRQLDYVFPGLWLASITPESYKVNSGTKKVKG